MIQKTFRSLILTGALLLGLLQLTAIAGPPLICHTIEIGDARSLPWGASADWRAVKPDYDLNRLVEDTLALLTPETPVLARMETLRRATIYAQWAKRDREIMLKSRNDKAADELLARLMARVRESAGNTPAFTLALFDAGYLTSCYQQAGYQSNGGDGAGRGYDMVRKAMGGYAMVRKAAAHQGGSAEMEFAAALITSSPLQATHRAHLQRAIDGAKDNSLLARNLIKHFGKDGQKLAELRAQIAAQ
ncbi:MAG: hypothetical protein J2P41_04910 [Blastocatellia bacterium]|nr:hypothetical protein [Blastocatellia bacterium]